MSEAYRVTEQIVNCGGMLPAGKNSCVSTLPPMYVRGAEAPFCAPNVCPGVIKVRAPRFVLFRPLPLWSISTSFTSSHLVAV
jgi:hypothetical protein